MSSVTPQQLTQALTSQGLPTPSPSFIASILTPPNSQRLPPLPALVATTKHRLLTADLTTPNILHSTNASLPANLSDVKISSTTLSTDVFVQVLDVDDLSKSKWEQIEALESDRKGETMKGREVIRVVAAPPDGDAPSLASTQAPTQGAGNAATAVSMGPFKLLFQDWKGQRIYGFELKRVEKVGYPPWMSIGCKILLKKGAKVARGMVLLEPSCVVLLGGKIESLDKIWRAKREALLRERVEQEKRDKDSGGGGGGRG
jgi:RecQ-mediated genome instability protein 1